MSKQSEAKEKQGYLNESPNCSSCKHFKFSLKLPAWMVNHNRDCVEGGFKAHYGEEHKVKKDLHCGIGGFKVAQRGSCKLIAV